MSPESITPIDIVQSGIIYVWESLVFNTKYYVTPWGNTSTSEVGNIYLGTKAVDQKILIKPTEKEADSFNFSRWWTTASWVITYSHNLWRKPKFIKFDGVSSSGSQSIISMSSWSWSEIWGNKAVYKRYDDPWTYTSSYCILNKFYAGSWDYQYGKVIEVTDTDITIEWVYGWGSTSNTTFYVTALLF